MFGHDQRRKGICEWRDGLEDFVAHYNHENRTSYTRTECLDIPRTGAQTDKAPEVLLTDSGTSRQMVVERKSVVWPKFFLQRHGHGHMFSNLIFHQTHGSFQGSHYELTVSTDELDHLNKSALKKIATEIGSVLMGIDQSSIPFRRSDPIHWGFRKTDADEYANRKGITVVWQQAQKAFTLESFIESFNPNAAIVGTVAAMEQELAEAAAKFTRYGSARKLVLLYFYGDQLGEEDIPPLLDRIALQQIIDEIWMAERDWVSEEDYDIGFKRIFVRAE